MILKKDNDFFILEMSTKESKRVLSKVLQDYKHSEGRNKKILANFGRALQEAVASSPLGTKQVVLDKNLVECVFELSWEKSRLLEDDNDGFWLDLHQNLKEASKAIYESKLPDFRQLLEESETEYSYRIKTIVELNDEQMASLENILQKYELISMEKPFKTVMHQHPLDFADVEHAEVFIIDVKTHLPVSAYVLQQELRAVLRIPEKYIVVRTDNDPMEVETSRQQALQQIEQEAREKGFEPASLLSVESEYPEAEYSIPGEEMYGDQYNSKFLEYLAQIAATRETENVDPPAPLFSWLNMGVQEVEDPLGEYSGADFNKDIPDAPKSYPWWEVDKDKEPYYGATKGMISPEGNFDNDKQFFSKYYKDEKGNTVAINNEPKTIRHEDKKK